MVGCTFTTCLSEQQYEFLKAKETNVNTTKQQTDTPSEKETDLPPPPPPTTTTTTTTTSSNSENNQSMTSNPSTTSSSPPTPAPKSSPSTANNLNRTNFNLRGHKHDIRLVRWNEPYQKLASCDSKGLIYVWVKYEGRWSIELINDRGNCVADFAWSHDGRMAVICYQDGFVLVGSVNGQRFWSHLYDLPQV
jgi:transglutaminase/protease-like cytokinesis protein 3